LEERASLTVPLHNTIDAFDSDGEKGCSGGLESVGMGKYQQNRVNIVHNSPTTDPLMGIRLGVVLYTMP